MVSFSYIEEGPRPLGSLGLHQFYLDMKFVICFASDQGRYLTGNLNRVVNEIISKALTAFSATGIDPSSELPEDDWFMEICQDAIEKLSGKSKAANGERDLKNPAASVSAQSVSSCTFKLNIIINIKIRKFKLQLFFLNHPSAERFMVKIPPQRSWNDLNVVSC
ncbi:Exocyst complex component 84b [Heracleum sosnowskyi]|uniref:Exocyst complex component 84b n=1 Tax=Heracleum sosnowskyi TaxID=360622 RepID=A0AAD8I1A0_9APIA|nr:Exocyst complex component 84b [Heracleum sosnowskyi]